MMILSHIRQMLNIPSELGISTAKDIILYRASGRYQGTFNPEFNKPRDDTRSSTAWMECRDVAAWAMSNSKTAGKYHWAIKSMDFPSYLDSTKTMYRFTSSTPFKKIVEKYVIGKHTFFRAEGDQYDIDK